MVEQTKDVAQVGRIYNGRLVTKDGIIEDGLVVIDGGTIVYAGAKGEFDGREHTSDVVDIDAQGGWIAPGFIDVHVHGGGGADVMDGTLDALRTMARSHARHGTTGFLATTMTAPHEQLLPVVRVVRQAVESDGRQGENPQGARILGLHLEGPYVNPQRAGAQNPEHMRPPVVEEVEQLLEAAGDTWRLVTMAPELPGAYDTIRELVQRGVRVSMGHTSANYEQGKRGIAAGATQLTHTFNAMNPLHHREPGLLGASVDDDNVFCELIADGLHVHPLTMRLLYRMKGADGIVLITDAMRAQGCGDGQYMLGDLLVTVRNNEARLATDDGLGALAGSLLTMDAALRTMVDEVGVPLHKAVRMATYNPARAIGMADAKGSLAKGKDADVVVLDDELHVQSTIVGGKIVFRR